MKHKIVLHFNLGVEIFVKRVWLLVKQPVFVVLTIVGNSLVALSSLLLFHFEHGVNPRINTWLDTLWWAVATVTTVGYGDISPVTTVGKIIGIFMMIVGTALFWCYTAMFAGVIINAEVEQIKKITNSDSKNGIKTTEL